MPAPWRIRRQGGKPAKFLKTTFIKNNGLNLPGIAYRFAEAFNLVPLGKVVEHG